MKKYSRPIITKEKYTDINETVFLASGEWSKSNCLITIWWLDQDVIDERPDERFSLYVYHGSNFHVTGAGQTATVTRDAADHTSQGFDLLIWFSTPKPSGVSSISVNGVEGEVSPDDPTLYRFNLSGTYYPINPIQDVGMANFYVDYHNGGAQVFDASFYPEAMQATDARYH